MAWRIQLLSPHARDIDNSLSLEKQTGLVVRFSRLTNTNPGRLSGPNSIFNQRLQGRKDQPEKTKYLTKDLLTH